MRHAIALLLVACSSADGGGGADAASTGTGGADPAAQPPDVAAGEVAVDVTIDGEAFGVNCEPGSPNTQILFAADFQDDSDLFTVSCGTIGSHPSAFLVLIVRDPVLGVGDVALAWGDTWNLDESSIIVTDADGNGFSASLDGDGGTELTGVLHLDALGGPGERVAGSFEYTWEKTSVVEEGTALVLEPIPGRAVGAFDLVLP